MNWTNKIRLKIRLLIRNFLPILILNGLLFSFVGGNSKTSFLRFAFCLKAIIDVPRSQTFSHLLSLLPSLPRSGKNALCQGSVSGSYLFNIFFNDLEIAPALESAYDESGYADDSTVIVPVYRGVRDFAYKSVEHFMKWTNENYMSYNCSKCKELIFS